MEIGIMAEDGWPERPMLYVRAIVGQLPCRDIMPFYRHLLETNDRLVGLPAFCVDPQNTVWMSTSRRIEGLDAIEVRDLLIRTHEMGRRYSQELASEFSVIS